MNPIWKQFDPLCCWCPAAVYLAQQPSIQCLKSIFFAVRKSNNSVTDFAIFVYSSNLKRKAALSCLLSASLSSYPTSDTIFKIVEKCAKNSSHLETKQSSNTQNKLCVVFFVFLLLFFKCSLHVCWIVQY